MQKLLCLLALFCLAASARADVTAQTAWVRATVPGQSSTGAFMDLTSSEDTSLAGVSTPRAKKIELHSMEMSREGLMTMREVERLLLPAGKTVRLAPGGYHLMLMDVQGTLKNGDRIPLTLTFENAQKKKQTLEVQAEVRGLGVKPPDKK